MRPQPQSRLHIGSSSSISALPISLRHSLLRPYQPLPRRLYSAQISQPAPAQLVRPLIPAPGENSGPLLSRRADRALPSHKTSYTWLKTLPIFVALVTLSSLAIFNYQKSSSSTVNSILYALRTNEAARAILGDNIYFASKVPWIRGELNLLHGHIDVTFWVKGTQAAAKTRFVSVRKRKDGFFETLEWSLTTDDGKTIQLLDKNSESSPLQKR